MKTLTVTFYPNVARGQMHNVLNDSGMRVEVKLVSPHVMQYQVEDGDVPLAVIRIKQHHPIIASY